MLQPSQIQQFHTPFPAPSSIQILVLAHPNRALFPTSK